ncbi:MAG: SH3 domain protein [Candidatus Azotimanducaceae bacterium]
MSWSTLVSACLLLIVCSDLLADTVYVRDTLYVPLRGGQSAEYRILHRGLKSGTELERFEVNEDTGYSRVRTIGGMEGWLQTQYLVEEPIASTRLGDVIGEFKQLEATHQQTLLSLREVSESGNVISADRDALTSQYDDLKAQYDALTALSENVIAIEQKNKQLNSEINQLGRRMNDILDENEALADDNAQQWFLYGSVTVFLGLLFGFWIGRRIYNRRHNSGWT